MKITAMVLSFSCGLILAGCAVQPGMSRENGLAVRRAKKKVFMQRRGGYVPAAPDLFGSAARGDLAGVQESLRQGTSVDSRNPNGATPLLLAAASGSLPVVQTLLGAGADVNAADNGGRTPLAAATAGGYDDVARALKAAGARGAAPSPAQDAAGGQWWQKDGASH